MARTSTITLAFALAALTHAGSARADGRGHFPLLEVGATGGFGSAPIPYTFDHGWGPTETSEGSDWGLVGPSVQAHLDARVFLLDLEGVYDALRTQDLGWMARAHVTLGKGLGGRSWGNLMLSMHDSAPDSSGTVTRTTEFATNRFVPFFYGVSGGVAVWSVNESSYSSAVDGTFTRDPDLLAAVDVGFTVKSPQLEATVAPLYEVTRGTMGLRWVFSMGLPIGRHVLAFRFTGDHFFGDDPVDNSGRRLSSVLLFTLGLSTSIGT